MHLLGSTQNAILILLAFQWPYSFAFFGHGLSQHVGGEVGYRDIHCSFGVKSTKLLTVDDSTGRVWKKSEWKYGHLLVSLNKSIMVAY